MKTNLYIFMFYVKMKYQNGLIIFTKKLHLFWKTGVILFQDNNISQAIFNYVF